MRTATPRLNALLPAFVLSLTTASTALAETVPARGKVDSRIRTTVYNAEEVYKLYGYVGYGIELVFEEGEVFAGKGGGDLEGVAIDGVSITSFQNHVHLKPKAPVVSTNLTLYSDRRVYRFDYTVFARPPNRFADEVMYAVRFIYPPKIDANGESIETKIERELAQANAVRPRNTDYWYCGRRSIKPVLASDDGVHTRLTFGSRSEIPAIFVRNEDGSESLLNYSMDARDVVIHRLAPKFILRRGRLTGCVVNKSFVGAGLRLDTGTVSPHIERDLKEKRP